MPYDNNGFHSLSITTGNIIEFTKCKFPEDCIFYPRQHTRIA